MKIAVDVDGVLANHVPHVLKRVQEKVGVTFHKSKVKLWNQSIPNTNLAIDSEIDAALTDPSYILTIPIIPYARQGIRELQGLGHTIVIATSRPSETDSYTLEWLVRKKIPFREFVNTRAKGKLNLQADIIIDDHFETAQDFARSKGFAILFSQPWNEKRGCPTDLIKARRLFCARGWPKVVKTVSLLSTIRSIPLV